MGKMKSNKNATTLAKNIRALRIYYGESQEDLAKILNCKQNAISQYETDSVDNEERHIPTSDTLKRLAQHFEITVFELENCDYSSIGKAEQYELFLYNNIDIIFPIISTDYALSNECFAKAHKLHKTIYKNLKNITNIDLAYSVIDANTSVLEEAELYYNKALKDKAIEAEAAVNLVSCYCLVILSLKVFQYACNEQGRSSASISLAKKLHPKFEKELNDIDVLSTDENKELESLISEFSGEMREYLIVSKSKYPDLINYYLSLQFILGFADNALDRFFNRRIGTEMMESFKSVGNKYATNYLAL